LYEPEIEPKSLSLFSVSVIFRQCLCTERTEAVFRLAERAQFLEETGKCALTAMRDSGCLILLRFRWFLKDCGRTNSALFDFNVFEIIMLVVENEKGK